MKRVLVTGATGFVGRHCLPALADRGFEVHAVSSRAAPPAEGAAVVWHRVDLLTERERVFELTADVRPTHLLHLAWYAVPREYWTSPENLRWVQASLDLFRAFAAAGGRRVVAAGTCAEYEWGHDAPCSERETPLNPATLYGACKHALQVILSGFAAQAGLSAAWGRIFFLYGPHEPAGRLVPSVVLSLLRNQPALCTHGGQVRDFLYVGDVAEAFAALLDGEVTGGVNIASGRPLALRDVIYEIGGKLGRSELIRLGAVEAPAGEPRVLSADAGRLKREVDWSPRYGLDEGLDRTISWWRGRLGEDGGGALDA